MDTKDILSTYRALLKRKDRNICSKPLAKNPITHPKNGRRPRSIAIEDAFFGDSGKGRVTAEFNELLGKKRKLITLRYNGGANAGHECLIDGKTIVTHQLPMGVIRENTTAIIGRGALLHPQDLLTEIESVTKTLNAYLPGTLLIDERTPLGLDTHRAFESALNAVTTGGRGSTGRGIAPGYASIYLRIPVTVKDLLDKNWKNIFSLHYQLYERLMQGFGKEFSLADTEVAALHKGKHKVGNKTVFLHELETTRKALSKFVKNNIADILQNAWKDPLIGFTFEGAQGAGLDPYHGVYPDVTASRSTSRGINDTTYNIILPDEIAVRVAVMKTTYMSSVGTRKLPKEKDEAQETWIQQTFDEKGRSTGRLRDIYPISLPIAQYLKKAAGYDYLAATHIDAARPDKPIKVVTHYTNHKPDNIKPYFPYQDYLDELSAHTVSFTSWDGQNTKLAKTPKDLPYETRLYLAFLSQTIAPVLFGTTDISFGSSLSWL